jgi:hypothetical protein
VKRRTIAAVLLLALTLQGPILAYLPVLVPCSSMPKGTNCDFCCSHGQCAVLCANSFTAMVATPVAPAILRVRNTTIPDPRIASFLGVDPAPPFRPPIV